MASGVYLPSFEDLLEGGLALPWDDETHRWALYDATRASAASFNADESYTTVGEIAGTGYVAGGELVTGTAFSRPGGGVARYSCNSVQWEGTTLSGVQWVDMYAAEVDGDPLMVGIDLVTPVNTSDGTLLITPHPNGLVSYNLIAA